MDFGRQRDLANLQAVIDSKDTPAMTRRIAMRSKRSILSESKDRRLNKMRERLIRAARNLDQQEEHKLVNQIRDYMKKERIDEDTGHN